MDLTGSQITRKFVKQSGFGRLGKQRGTGKHDLYTVIYDGLVKIVCFFKPTIVASNANIICLDLQDSSEYIIILIP